jgi:hypothetical protein
MDCAYHQRHSEYYLYGLLWRKSGSPPESLAGDDEEGGEDRIFMRPSRRISSTPDTQTSINPLQNDDLGTSFRTDEHLTGKL